MALAPQKMTDTLAFMFESRYPMLVLESALALPARQTRYHESWQGFERTFRGA
jgi:homogentisate 1,2-dioxygenase